jgi:sigma-B regulation protein RsbU (phosphoserine phosphatase)
MAYVTRGTGELEQTGFWKHRKKDGAIIDVEVTAHPIHFLGRSAMLVLAHDVTARRRAEAEVRRLASIVESTGDAIISMTIEGEIVSWNAAAERLYGFSAEEVKGNHLSLLAAPGHADEIPYLLRRVRNGERLNNWETRWTSRDGSILDVSVTYSPIRDAEGVVIGASTKCRRRNGGASPAACTMRRPSS